MHQGGTVYPGSGIWPRLIAGFAEIWARGIRKENFIRDSDDKSLGCGIIVKKEREGQIELLVLVDEHKFKVVFVNGVSSETNFLPTTTVYALGFGFLSTQCAAVTIQSSLMRDPPQICLPRTRREICHGQEWGLASWPFTTREKAGRMPQPINNWTSKT